MGEIHRCLSCGQAITWRFAICYKCEQIYGRSSLVWPEWLRYLWKVVQQERRRQRKRDRYEVSLETLEVQNGKVPPHNPQY